MGRFIGMNEMGGVEEFLYDHTNDTAIVRKSYDISDYLDANKAALTNGTNGWSQDRTMKKVASIPLALAEKWLTEEGIDATNKEHWPAIRRKLNSSDYAHLRTSTGRI